MIIEDVINDCYVDLTNLKPSDQLIEQIKNEIPIEINLIGKQWGFNDTEFGDALYKWLRKYIKDV